MLRLFRESGDNQWTRHFGAGCRKSASRTHKSVVVGRLHPCLCVHIVTPAERLVQAICIQNQCLLLSLIVVCMLVYVFLAKYLLIVCTIDIHHT